MPLLVSDVEYRREPPNDSTNLALRLRQSSADLRRSIEHSRVNIVESQALLRQETPTFTSEPL